MFSGLHLVNFFHFSISWQSLDQGQKKRSPHLSKLPSIIHSTIIVLYSNYSHSEDLRMWLPHLNHRSTIDLYKSVHVQKYQCDPSQKGADKFISPEPALCLSLRCLHPCTVTLCWLQDNSQSQSAQNCCWRQPINIFGISANPVSALGVQIQMSCVWSHRRSTGTGLAVSLNHSHRSVPEMQGDCLMRPFCLNLSFWICSTLLAMLTFTESESMRIIIFSEGLRAFAGEGKHMGASMDWSISAKQNSANRTDKQPPALYDLLAYWDTFTRQT